MNLNIVKSKLAPHNKNVLWFDTSNNTLKIYDNGWKSVLKEVVREILNENTEKIVSDIVSELQKGVQMSESDFAIKGTTGSVKFNKTTAAITYNVENTDSGRDVYENTTKISPVELSTSIKASNGKSALFKVGSDSIKAESSAGMTFEPEGKFKVSAGEIEMTSEGSIKVHAEQALNFRHDSGSSFNVSVDNSHGSENTLKLKKDGFDLQVFNSEDELTTRIQASSSALRFKGKGDINIDDKKRLYINAAEGGAIRITGFGEYDTPGVTYKEIHPNIHYRFGEVDELEVVLAEPSTGNYKKEYSFEFTALSNSSNIKLPAGVLWETPFEIKERTLYQIKILNNVGTINSCYIPTLEERYMYLVATEGDYYIWFTKPYSYMIEGTDDWVNKGSGQDSANIPAGKKVYVKMNGTNGGQLNSNLPFDVGGNIKSLVLGDNAYNGSFVAKRNEFSMLFWNTKVVSAQNLIIDKDIMSYGCFSQMFEGCSNLIAPPLLPATTLDHSCYHSMFKYCTKLSAAPELPSTSLSSDCYQEMFYGCTSLTVAPELPATEMKTYCYYRMFYGCTSLTVAPELPATKIEAEACYKEMFYGCTSLNYVKALFLELIFTIPTKNWLSGVASSGTFVKSADATWDKVGPSGVPEGWTILTE